MQTSREKMECCNETFREDFERFNMVKTLDIKAMLVQLADHHIQSYEKVKFVCSLRVDRNFFSN